MIVRRVGRLTYLDGLEEQGRSRARVSAGQPDELLLLEHEPVVTLGRRGGDWNAKLVAELGIPVIETNRGGLATWHGPGQLVAYPIVDLRRLRLSVPRIISILGAVMCEVAAEHGLSIEYTPEQPGVYRQGRKLGSIGLHIARGVTMHGLALNVSNDLNAFRVVTPCGNPQQAMSSLSVELGHHVSLESTMDAVARILPRALGSRSD